MKAGKELNFPNKIKTSKNYKDKPAKITDIVFTALFVAVIVVCSQIIIPLGQIPVTLQMVGVFLSASVLGAKWSSVSVAIYILLGIVGLPVFSGFSSGLGYLLGPTGGYIIGFFFTALVVGFITEKLGKSTKVLVISMVLGLLVCYVVGITWFCVVMKSDFIYGVLWCVLPYIIPDVIKIVFSVFMVNRLCKAVKL